MNGIDNIKYFLSDRLPPSFRWWPEVIHDLRKDETPDEKKELDALIEREKSRFIAEQ